MDSRDEGIIWPAGAEAGPREVDSPVTSPEPGASPEPVGEGVVDQAEVRADEAAGTSVWEWVALGAVFVAVYTILFILYRPNLLLATTTTSGGDMGAHHYPAKFMIEDLLPHFRLTGWAPQWYAGMPMFTFYLPLPFLLIALLNLVLPYTVAFKLVTVLGVFALPAGRVRVRPALAGAASPSRSWPRSSRLVFLLMESYSIYGGEHPQHAGRRVRLLHQLRADLPLPRHPVSGHGASRVSTAFFALNGLILMCVVLSHIVTTIVAGGDRARACSLIHRRWRSLLYLVAVFFLGFLLTAFWGLPFVDKLPVDGPHGLGPADGRSRTCCPGRSGRWRRSGVLGMAYAVAQGDEAPSPVLDRRADGGALLRRCPTGGCGTRVCCPSCTSRCTCGRRTAPRGWCGPFVVMVRDLLAAWHRSSGAALRAHAGGDRARVTAILGKHDRVRLDHSGTTPATRARRPGRSTRQINDFIGSLPPGRVMWEHSPEAGQVRHAARLRDHPLLDQTSPPWRAR